MRNPFSTKDPVTKIAYTELDYAMRIQKLMSRHLIRMVNGDVRWIVTVPEKGNVQMIPTKMEGL
jgi:hypothetical protein